jgi:hypothetical protein
MLCTCRRKGPACALRAGVSQSLCPFVFPTKCANLPTAFATCPSDAEDALSIFEQGTTAPEAHAPLFAAYAALAERMGRPELAADVQRRLDALLAA